MLQVDSYHWFKFIFFVTWKLKDDLHYSKLIWSKISIKIKSHDGLLFKYLIGLLMGIHTMETVKSNLKFNLICLGRDSSEMSQWSFFFATAPPTLVKHEFVDLNQGGESQCRLSPILSVTVTCACCSSTHVWTFLLSQKTTTTLILEQVCECVWAHPHWWSQTLKHIENV